MSCIMMKPIKRLMSFIR